MTANDSEGRNGPALVTPPEPTGEPAPEEDDDQPLSMEEDPPALRTPPMIRSPLDRLLGVLLKVRRTKEGYSASCPLHHDSVGGCLMIGESDSGLVLSCRKGCQTDAVLGALGLTPSALLPRKASRSRRAQWPSKGTTAPKDETIDWGGLAETFQQKLSPACLADLLRQIPLPEASLLALGAGWHTDEMAWTFPERNAQGEVINILLMSSDGSTKTMSDEPGLYVPVDWDEPAGPVYCSWSIYGTAALHSRGLATVGLATSDGEVELLAELFSGIDRPIIIVGDNLIDREVGRIGRDSAVRVATELGSLKREVRFTLPPAKYECVYEWVRTQEAKDAT